MTAPDVPCRLLGELTPAQFMQRHWQKKPLLVRSAVADANEIPVARARLFKLAQHADVESRLITGFAGEWRLRHGPLPRRALPALDRPGWTLLVQGVDRHDEAMHRFLQKQFDFLPAARLDDVMVSYASDRGGVGAHVDRYDVFLLQARGQRRWRIGQAKGVGTDFVPDLPLKILARFEPQQAFLLEPGDLLYLPPNWAHEGTAVGADCITCSVGFRAPAQHELAADLLARLADRASEVQEGHHFHDPAQEAVATPGRIPDQLIEFARNAVRQASQVADAVPRVLGEQLSEPHASVWFEAGASPSDTNPLQAPLRLDRRSRMLYDAHCIYLNGESRAASGREARILRRLADRRQLDAVDLRGCSTDLRACLIEWIEAGWLHAEGGAEASPRDS